MTNYTKVAELRAVIEASRLHLIDCAACRGGIDSECTVGQEFRGQIMVLAIFDVHFLHNLIYGGKHGSEINSAQ